MPSVIFGVLGAILWTAVMIVWEKFWYRVSAKPDISLLVITFVAGSMGSMACGFLVALIDGENKRGPLIFGVSLAIICLARLLVLPLYTPLWFHLILAAIVIPIAIFGGRLKYTQIDT